MQKIIEKIHREFDTAQDRLLEEAKRLISTIDYSKAERLMAAGFVKSEAVTKSESLKMNRELAEIITYHKQTYPFQKFLTVGELDRICGKYKLVYAPVSSYLKNVPDKNLSDIESAPTLKHNDAPSDITKCRLRLERWVGGGRAFLSVTSKWQRLLPKELDGHRFSQYDVDRELNGIYRTGITYLVKSIENITISRQGLFIAAPPSHFDKKGLMKTSKFGLHSFLSVEVKDPIVFRYCRGGVQVVTKWGLEGEDAALVNEKLN